MRSLWKGSLSFGLVNIPVEMFTASQTREFKFTLLHKKDLSEIRYARICKEEGKEVPWSDIVKGIETSSGKYIVLTEEELKSAALKKSDSIEIVQFVDEDEVDSIYYDKPYVLQPGKGGAKSYALLIEALKKSKKYGIATYTIHNRGHIGVVKPEGNLLILNQLRYHSDVLNLKDFKAPAVQKLSAKEVDIAVQLIKKMTSAFKPEKFKDNYDQVIKELIKQKSKGKKIPKAKAPAKPSGKIHDIMSLLKASLKEKDKKSKKRAWA